MEITFYSSPLELGTPLKEKVKEALDEIIQKAGFLEGEKEETRNIQAKVSVEKERRKFKLTVELIFSGQKMMAAGKGDDLYLLVDLVRHKLERETHRYRKRRLKLEKKGNQLWKRLKIWPPKDFFRRRK